MIPNTKYLFILKAAMDKEFNIGSGNKLPWKLPNEMKNFKKDIKSFPLVMGRNTCESIKKPLNDKPNYVLTSNKHYKREGFITVNSISDLMSIIPKDEIIYVIGGESIYRAFLQLGFMHPHSVAVNAELTIIDNVYPDCDSKFPMNLINEYKYSADYKAEGRDGDVFWKERFYYKPIGR